MSKTYREQHPLLCDELSEDEHYSPRYQRRSRPMTYRGRAKNSIKGAAAIFKLWPDHWATFLTYWWIALGMLALTTLVIYNALFAFAVIPKDNIRPLSQIITDTNYKQRSRIPEVYMHLFSDFKDDIDMHQYIPYIEIISKKYPDLKYHLVIIINDTSLETNNLSAEENNEIALNSLWRKEKTVFNHPNHNDIIGVEYVTLSEYMNNSPLKRYWRSLSKQLLKFLIRAVAIWNKGGIAFDPVILTPRSPHAAYIEKLQNILHDYNQLNRVPTKDLKGKKINIKKSKKYKQKVNNIRDVIDALENEDNPSTYSEQILTEAENRDNVHVTRNIRKLFSVSESLNINETLDNSEESVPNYPKTTAGGIKEEHSKETGQSPEIHLDHSSVLVQPIAQTNTTKMNLLPLFLEYLFHNKVHMKTSRDTYDTTNDTPTPKETVVKVQEKSNPNITSSITKDRHKHISDRHKPMIVSTKFIHNQTDVMIKIENSSRSDNGNQLIIDLRGNIIATETPCHAFLGTIFSNAVHHSEDETVTDFIIAELSIFCKGLLSTCMGIDLILL